MINTFHWPTYAAAPADDAITTDYGAQVGPSNASTSSVPLGDTPNANSLYPQPGLLKFHEPYGPVLEAGRGPAGLEASRLISHRTPLPGAEHPVPANPTVSAKHTTRDMVASASESPHSTNSQHRSTPDQAPLLDAPTQPRKYVVPAVTSRKILPAAFGNRQRGVAANEAEMTEDILSAVIEDKRYANTVAARINRQKKQAHVRKLEEELEATKQALNKLLAEKSLSGTNVDHPGATLGTTPPIEHTAPAVDNPDKDGGCSILEVTKSIIISRKMLRQLASEIIPHLVCSGCADVTGRLDLGRCGSHPIAGGGFGDIYQGALVCGTRVAIKCPRLFLKNDEQGSKILKNVAREIYAWSKLKHPNVLELVGLSMFRGQISIVSAWMENGTLPEYIVANPGVDRYQLCIQISAGLAHLHESDTVHGDMKGSNVLISDKGIVKLTDFGNAVLKKYTLEFTGTTSGSKISVRWTAPEVLRGESAYTKEADVYALGMTFYETVTGKTPFSNKVEQAVFVIVLTGKRPERPEELDAMEGDKVDVLWKAMSRCWDHKAVDRPSAFEVEYSLEGVEKNQAQAQSRGNPLVSSTGTEYFTPR
ncbi:hypothetical protein FRC10_005435 [Ceratobasidium sp. 414]|nr:hypothetical protein FRC10_005435 [Ceratobasidium sp. 414]